MDWRVIEVNKRSYTENQRCTERMAYSAHTTKAGKLAETAESCDYCIFQFCPWALNAWGYKPKAHEIHKLA